MKIFQGAAAGGFLLMSSLTTASAKEIVYNWKLVSVLSNEYSPDCQNLQLQRRSLFLAQPLDDNGDPLGPPSMPGPVMEATEGDTFVVRITNDHPSQETSIHFHGIHQVGTPYADGPSHLTQCPLGSFQTQEYRFEAYPPGTHYWHAHNGMQIADGLSGPLIVHPLVEDNVIEYDEDRILYLEDFYSETGEQQRAGLDNYPFTWVGNPDSLLINGKGLAPLCIPPDGASAGDVNICLETCNETLSWIPTIEVDAGMTYRFRIINAGQLAMQNVAIVGHELTIVEVEGTLLDPPMVVSNYDVAPGQRVSVLVVADQEPNDYWIETSVRGRNMTGLNARAILHYTSGNNSEPTLPMETPYHPPFDDFENATALEDSLYTMNPMDYPEAVALTAAADEIERWVVVGTQNTKLDAQGNVTQLRWAMNNISDSYMEPEPLITKVARMALENGWPTDLGYGTVEVPKMPPVTWNYTELVGDPGGPGGNLGQQGTAVIQLKKGQVFEIVLQNARALNGAAEFHPWHVHGHSFWVVGRGEGIFDPETDPANYNLENPLLRDTVNLWPLGWTALRLVADNPGVWYFHCHLTSHLVMGMSFILVVEPDMIGDPAETTPLCQQSEESDQPNDDGDDATTPAEDADGAWSPMAARRALILPLLLSSSLLLHGFLLSLLFA